MIQSNFIIFLVAYAQQKGENELRVSKVFFVCTEDSHVCGTHPDGSNRPTKENPDPTWAITCALHAQGPQIKPG